MLPLLAPAHLIAAGLARGDFSSRELVDAYIERIEGVAGRAVNAVVARRFDQARSEATAADVARSAGRKLGPLAGVPITVKEAFDVAGLPSTFGHTARREHKAPSNAIAVSRLIGAGAVVLGKTNVPKDLADWQSFNDVYGVTQNPWNLACTPGGSSGGSSAALAAGFSALELGSDIAGSIRVPAVYCGVWGHKPTYGIVPIRGHGMIPGEPPSDILVAGPLARSATDLEIALDIVAGPDEAAIETAAWSLSLPREPRRNASQFRIAILADDARFPVDAAIRDALASLAGTLEAEGARIDREPVLPITSDDSYELFLTLLRGATSTRYALDEFEVLSAKAASFTPGDRSYDALSHRGMTQRHRSWIEADAARLQLRRRWRAFFEGYDALICPVTATPPFPHMIGVPKHEQFFMVDGAARPASDYYYWIGIPSLAYLPATAFPLGLTRDGLPIGAQIIGREYGDYSCIRIAQIIENVFRGFQAPDL